MTDPLLSLRIEYNPDGELVVVTHDDVGLLHPAGSPVAISPVRLSDGTVNPSAVRVAFEVILDAKQIAAAVRPEACRK